MTRRSLFLSAALIPTICLVLQAEPANAATYSFSGKTLATHGEWAVDLSGGPRTATILKGKKKNMLVIEVTASTLGGHELCLNSVKVNGLPAAPSSTIFSGGTNVICEGSTTEVMEHVVSGVYFFDIDEGETVSPGTFYSQPLNVVVQPYTDAGFGGSISIVVRMEKK